jgi:Zn-finger nucleic acid-binding protein
MSKKNICPLCNEIGIDFYNKNGRVFYQCPNCKGIFIPEKYIVTPFAEKERYLEHNNDVHNKAYQNFVRPITSSIIQNHSTNEIGLDFGSGTGPVISLVLEENNFQIKKYDPFFCNNHEVLDRKYNFVICCEVIEHFHNPYKEFNLLKKLLHVNGKLYCMTDIYDKSIDFKKWYYKNDITHVFIYQKETLEWIKNEFNFAEIKINNRLIIFIK